MRKIILVAAMVLASASAHAVDRSLSQATATAAPQGTTATAPTTQISEVAPAAEAPKYVDRPPAVSASAPAVATAPAVTATTTTSAPAATATKTAKAGKPKHKRSWTEGRIISELHRHGIYW